MLALAAERSDGTTWSVTYLPDSAGRSCAGVYAGSETTSPVAFGILTSERGDVAELIDLDGTPFAYTSYDAYGNPGADAVTGTTEVSAALARSIADANVLRYAGYCFDAFSGLYYCSQRYYDPATAQFITKDPAKADGEESAYQYCGGDPVGKTDPSGLAYSANAALSYARAWWNGFNTAYYPKFDHDCTNFVSQCLFAGGQTMNSTWKVYKSWGRWKCTSTWSVADKLYDYLLSSKRGSLMGTCTKVGTRGYWWASALPGDLLFYDFGPTPDGYVDHGAIVSYSDRYMGTLKAQHTSPQWHTDWRSANRWEPKMAKAILYLVRPK